MIFTVAARTVGGQAQRSQTMHGFPSPLGRGVCTVTKDRLSVGKNNHDSVLPDELDNMSGFEGKGGPEAPVPATQSIDVPLENAIGRKPSWATHQADKK